MQKTGQRDTWKEISFLYKNAENIVEKLFPDPFL